MLARTALREPSPLALVATPPVRPRVLPDGRVPISACVITFNEAHNVARCLASLSFCDEIVVIDSRSTDATREIALAHGARVIVREWSGYRAQKQYALETCAHDWVLSLNADEVVSAELRTEILALRARGFEEGVAGYSMPRCTEYFGRMIRRGAWYPDRKLRLVDRRRARWGGREIHEKMVPDGAVRKLAGDLEHFSYLDLDDQLARLEKYAELMARALHAEGRRAHWWHIVLSPAWRGFRDLFVKRGALEGWRGFAIAMIEMNYVRQKFLKLWLLERGLPIGAKDRALRRVPEVG